MPIHSIYVVALFITVLPILAEQPHAVLEIDKLPPQGKTLVWSPLFQASWDKLNAMHGGKPEKVLPPNELIESLDQFQWKEDEVMPKDAYATFAGPATLKFAKDTAADIKKQFGVEMTPSNLPVSPRGVAIYSILLRNLKFQKKFLRSQKKLLSFKDSLGGTHEVEFFGTIGTHSDNYKNCVKVLDFKDSGKSFVLSVATNIADEKLIIYRPKGAPSFKTAIEYVKAATQNPFAGPYGSLTDGALHKKDTVKIPYLTLKAHTFFTNQLKGDRYYAGDVLPWEIQMAYQITNFELFEKGARIRVETAMSDLDPFGPAPPPKRITYVPRNFICDEPFFVFAWREEAPWPYFAAWIDGNAALKSPSPRKPNP